MDIVIVVISFIVLIWSMVSMAWVMGRVIKELHGLREDNAKAAAALAFSDEHVTRRVEEQNMNAVLKRLDALESRSSTKEGTVDADNT